MNQRDQFNVKCGDQTLILVTPNFRGKGELPLEKSNVVTIKNLDFLS